MCPLRRMPSDRRAARLVALTTPLSARPEPADVSGLDALGRVIAAYGPERLLGRGEAREADRALRAAARRLAAEARAHDSQRAELLLVDLKRVWPGLPAVQTIPITGARQALWDRLVSLCLEEFYAAGSASAPVAPRASHVA